MTQRTTLAVRWHSIRMKKQLAKIALAAILLATEAVWAQQYCEDFVEGTIRQHQGKSKEQFCDPRDGTKYVYVDIGNQTWMAENLNYKGANADKPMGGCLEGKPENCEKYGRLYKLDEMFCSSGSCAEEQWGVADPNEHTTNIACPVGWHLPSTSELEELLAYSDPNFVPGTEALGTGKNSAATKLKSASWGTSNNTDELGFSGLPGGLCGSGCPDMSKSYLKHLNVISSFWWSHAYGAPVPLAKSWRMSENSAVVDDAYQSYSTSAFYVRCLKNKTSSPKTPEPMPETIACSGDGEGQKCHYGQWKNYFTDSRDGKEYPYVELGGKTWMAANLNYAATNSKCYNGFDANCDTYGRLYNFAATSDVCPSGWTLPTNAEWTALTTAVGGLTGTATKLKTGSGWVKNGTDDYGFAALPGGYGNLSTGNYGGLSQTIIDFGSARGGFWWSASKVAANGAYIRHIGPSSDNITSVDNDFSRLYSVRCISSGTGTFVTSSELNTTYSPGLRLSSLTLPEGYAWAAPNTLLNAGDGQRFAATYTNGNYTKASGSIKVNVANGNNIEPSSSVEPSSSSSEAIQSSSSSEEEKSSSSSEATQSSSSSTGTTLPSSSSATISPPSRPTPIFTNRENHKIGGIGVQTTNNAILLSNLPQGAKVEVYNLQGKRIYFGNSGNSKTLQVQVQTGMYIVKVGSQIMRTVVR